MTGDDYDFADDFAKSIEECYRVIKDRVANGGPGWPRASQEGEKTMTDDQRLAGVFDGIADEVNAAAQVATYRPNGNGHDVPTNIDVGVENILRAGNLSAKAMRESSEESAARALAAGAAVIARAKEIEANAQAFAEAVRKHGDRMATEIEQFSNVAKTIATNMASTKALIPDTERQQ